MRGPKTLMIAHKRPDMDVMKQRKISTRSAPKKEKAKRNASSAAASALKRPAGPFFVFMAEFRKTFKEENPNNNSVTQVGKAGGEKWKSMSPSEKAPFLARAAQLKAEYEKARDALNQKMISEEDTKEEESSEVSTAAVQEEDDGEVSG